MARYAGGAEDDRLDGYHGAYKQMGGWTALAVILGGAAGVALVARILGIG